MYKVIIDISDYDSPYRVLTETIEVSSISEAVDYCEKQSSRRDSYTISSVYSDGKDVDFKLILRSEEVGIDGVKTKMLSQLNEHIEKVANINSLEDIRKLQTLHLFI